MTTPIDALVEKFRQACGDVGESEQHVLHRLTQRLHVSRDTNREFDAGLTFGQRLADRVAAFVGSWVFILLFIGLLILWIALNSFILTRIGKPFDIYPYIFLNLVLSMVAALQAPLIMMSQNRQSAKDRLEARDGGTHFTYTNEFKTPFGPLGKVASGAVMGGLPEREATASLQRLKALVEGGG